MRLTTGLEGEVGLHMALSESMIILRKVMIVRRQLLSLKTNMEQEAVLRHLLELTEVMKIMMQRVSSWRKAVSWSLTQRYFYHGM